MFLLIHDPFISILVKAKSLARKVSFLCLVFVDQILTGWESYVFFTWQLTVAQLEALAAACQRLLQKGLKYSAWIPEAYSLCTLLEIIQPVFTTTGQTWTSKGFSAPNGGHYFLIDVFITHRVAVREYTASCHWRQKSRVSA